MTLPGGARGYVGVSRGSRSTQVKTARTRGCADRRPICFAVRRKKASRELVATFFYGEHAGMHFAERLAGGNRRVHPLHRVDSGGLGGRRDEICTLYRGVLL